MITAINRLILKLFRFIAVAVYTLLPEGEYRDAWERGLYRGYFYDEEQE